MIKILIADDHPIVRSGLKEIVGKERDMVVEGEAQDAQELLELVRKQHWDVVVLDINMPGRSGLDVLRQLKKEYPRLPVLILSVQPEEQYAVRALKSGASGYLTKLSVPGELVKAIRRVVVGGKYISSTLAERLAFDLETSERPLHETLSDRELKVMCMIASGKRITEIAKKLFVSPKTVTTYRVRILEKMGMKTNADLTHYVIENKLVD
jgi:two-component system invasion response regulator UvrY